jgi:hypothetical protein
MSTLRVHENKQTIPVKQSFFNRSVVTEIEINASAEKVWQILTDLEKYAEWNPFIVAASGEVKVGNHINATFQPNGSKPTTFTPTILKAEPNQELRWLGKVGSGGIFNGEHSFVIEPLGNNRVKLHHSEKFTGLLVPLFGKDIKTKYPEGFAALNQALKQRAESF